jgi:hypothetical protein
MEKEERKRSNDILVSNENLLMIPYHVLVVEVYEPIWVVQCTSPPLSGF